MYHQLKQNNFTHYLMFIIVIWAVVYVLIADLYHRPVTKGSPVSESVPTVSAIATALESSIHQQPSVEPVPEDSVRLYDNVPFSPELQNLLWVACEETGCPYELALSVIWCETRFQNINGDNGDSIGYMQIQPKWHKERMERLGVTDLSDPLSNFRVGCDFLAELIAKYGDEEKALTCYNTGSPGKSEYATRIIEYMTKTFLTE